MTMKVPSKIVPAGSFPVVDDLNVKGGFKVVASQAALADLPLYNLRNGAFAITADTGELWKYQTSTSTWFKWRVHLNNLPSIPLNKIVGGIAKDAFRSVATLVDLAELPTGELDTGVVCLVQDSNVLYEYNGLTSTWSILMLSIGNIPTIPGDNVGSGLHGVAFSGDYNELINIPANASVDAEVAARTAADAAEVVARTAADVVLQGNITAEAVARTAADLVVQGNLDSEVAARVAADTTLTTNLAAEVTNRANADSTLQSNIAAEASARAAAIADEVTARTTALALKYDATNPSGFQTLAEVNSAIAAVVGAAPEALNTLQEIATQLAADESAATALTTTVASKAATTYVDSQDAAEATARSSADTTLQTNITNEATARGAADTTLTNNLATEVTNRTTADTTLQANIDAEATARAAADTTLQSNIDAVSSGATTVNTRLTNSHFVYDGSTPMQVHSITHNLGVKFCQVAVYDALNVLVTDMATVTAINTNQLEVDMGSSLACTVAISAPKA